jgi:hypothetical protein
MGEEAFSYDGPEEVAETVTDVVVEPVKEAETKQPEVEEKPQEPEAKKAPPPLTEEQQAVVNDAIGKKVAKQREAERKAQEYEQQLAEARQKLQQYEAPVRPDIPPPPDPYEDNFAAKVAHRDAMIAKAAQFDARQDAQREQEAARQQQAAAEQKQKLAKAEEDFIKNGTNLGIDRDELYAASMRVAPHIAGPIGLRVLNDPQGPEIAQYLDKNPLELDKLARMEVFDAAIYIENTIKPKAKRAPPKLAPEPTENLSGAAMKEAEKGPPNVKYE